MEEGPVKQGTGRAPGLAAGLTVRSLVTAVFLAVLAGIWIRQAEIVVLSTQISESVPAIPGLAALVFLLPINALLRLIPFVRPYTRAELLVIFLFVTVSSTVIGVGVQRFLIALLGYPFYFPAGGTPSIWQRLPNWLMPHDQEVMRQLYERSLSGRVPWEHWWLPALAWTGFFAALWITLYCLMGLFYRAWSEDERLSFPLVALPMEMVGDEAGRSFFRNPVMWLGFGVAAVYNLINILHALYPSFPAIGKEVDFSPAFQTPPWNAMVPFSLHLRPEMIGLGYLVATDISLTVWVAYFLMKLAAVLSVASGYPERMFPMAQEQGIGGYLVMALLLIWNARRQLRQAWRIVAGDAPPPPEGSGIPSYRVLLFGLVAGFAAVWGFMIAAGMAAWVALVYLLIVVAVALVYGRLRAEVGPPLLWLFPYYMQKQVLLYTFGSLPFTVGASTMPAWAVFTLLSRGYFPTVTGYQVEAMEISRRAGINPRRVGVALLLAVIVGLAIGWYEHLTPYYQLGAQNLRGGIWGTGIARTEYMAVLQYESVPKLPEPPRVWATATGGVVTLGLWVLRTHFVGFLLHPLGYLMACSYGDLIWASFLIVWLCKFLVLRYGGIMLYRRTVPFFLGLAFGHFAIAGIFWGLTGVRAGDAVLGYPVFFG